MSANKLTVNCQKTNFTIFSPRKKQTNFRFFDSITVDNNVIHKTTSTKYLGIIIDEQMTWKEHIELVCTKLRRLTSMFYKVRKKIPTVALRQLYFAFAYSAIQYGVEIYANTKKTFLNELNVLNNRILRILQFKNRRTKVSEMFRQYETLPVKQLHDYKLCLFVFKCLCCPELLPTALSTYFTQNMNFHNHNTRASRNIHIERHNTYSGKRSLHYRAAIVWNELPIQLRSVNVLSTFKNRLKLHFISK